MSSGTSTFGANGLQKISNLKVINNLTASTVSVNDSLYINSQHNDYANILLGNASSIYGTFVGGGPGSVLTTDGFTSLNSTVSGMSSFSVPYVSSTEAQIDWYNLASALSSSGDVSTNSITGHYDYQVEIQDGATVYSANLINVVGLTASSSTTDPTFDATAITFTLDATITLNFAGYHIFRIFPRGGFIMQCDSRNNKVVFGMHEGESFESGTAENRRRNGRIALEAGAIISNVIADPSDLTTNTVPQMIFENASERWRMALLTDTDGIIKLTVQRWIGYSTTNPTATSTNPTGTVPWETVSEFQGSQGVLGSSLSLALTSTSEPIAFNNNAASSDYAVSDAPFDYDNASANS